MWPFITPDKAINLDAFNFYLFHSFCPSRETYDNLLSRATSRTSPLYDLLKCVSWGRYILHALSKWTSFNDPSKFSACPNLDGSLSLIIVKIMTIHLTWDTKDDCVYRVDHVPMYEDTLICLWWSYMREMISTSHNIMTFISFEHFPVYHASILS